ncbi:hypothetical protein ZWY2020_006497 [Hordeum vulgare]|nr:hypothetical protein ZWY2020_006497 [Hordeum vulgare]
MRPSTVFSAVRSRLCSPRCRRAIGELRSTVVSANGPPASSTPRFALTTCALGLGMFDTVDDAVRAYDPAAWCLNRPRRDMNFPEVMTREWAQRLAPPPRVVIEEDRRQNRRWDRRLGIAEMDEHAMAAWRQEFLHDVLDERAFFAERKAERRAKRAAYREDRRTRKQAALFNMELKEASTWSSDDDRWAKDFIRTEELDTSASEENDEE